MGFFGWVLLIFVGVVTIAIILVALDANKAKKNGTALQTQPDFTPAVIYRGSLDSPGVAIDPSRNKFAISYGARRTHIFNFSDLVAVEVLKDGTSIQKTNRGSQFAGAAVGAALLGPVGLLAGAVTGSKRFEEKIRRLSLKILTNDLVNPVHEIIFLNAPNGVKAASLSNNVMSRELDTWHGRFQTILHGQAKF